MSLLIAWLIVGTISFMGLLAEYYEDGIWVKGDLWGVPLGGLILIVAGPLPYLAKAYKAMKDNTNV